jgi:hypothetical protein
MFGGWPMKMNQPVFSWTQRKNLLLCLSIYHQYGRVASDCSLISDMHAEEHVQVVLLLHDLCMYVSTQDYWSSGAHWIGLDCDLANKGDSPELVSLESDAREARSGPSARRTVQARG